MACNENTPLLHCTSERRTNHIVDIPTHKQQLDTYNESTSSLDSDISSSSSLSMEELQFYKEDPCWHNFRLCAFCAFWVMWLLILIAACLLAYMQKDTCGRPQGAQLSTAANVFSTVSAVTKG